MVGFFSLDALDERALLSQGDLGADYYATEAIHSLLEPSLDLPSVVLARGKSGAGNRKDRSWIEVGYRPSGAGQ